jgi:Zn-dependent peptidase ImmA (M78 family)
MNQINKWDEIKRKNEIIDITEALTTTYFENLPIEPEIIAKEEGITFCYGNYKNSFDGLLQHRSGDFHIFINIDRLKDSKSPRARFTFAHELGHYYIDAHRNALKQGLVPQHPSFNKLTQKNPIESEADYFASCLLMPAKEFKKICNRRPLSSLLIEDLSKVFNTSISSTIFRYFDLNLFPMIIVFAKDNIVQWHMRTNDFTYWSVPQKGMPVPSTTAAGEFFTQKKVYQKEEIIFAGDWFTDNKKDLDQEMYEKCYYNNNSVLSVIWLKENKLNFGYH